MSTLDNSVADISDGVVEILSTNGDVYLGGSDIDKVVADYVVDDFKSTSGADIAKDPQAMTRVLEAVEKAKIELSNASSTDINIPYITIKDNVPQHLTLTLTRAKFEALIDPIVNKLISCAKKAVELAKIQANELDGILLIGGSCRIPKVQEALTKEFGVTLLKSSNMDLAVAEGAAIQANNIVGGEGSTDILLVDVCPISLGIETMNGVFTKLIEANTTIPCSKEETFTTGVQNQTVVTVNVLQGERPMARDNKSLGQFNLEGILPAPAHVPQILVKFDMDVNGILNVSAKDKATGKEQSIRIEGSGKLDQAEIDRIKAEAEKYAEADKKERELAEVLNKGENIVYSQEKMLEDQKATITEDEKKKIEGLIDEMKKAVKDKNVSKINELEGAFNDAWQSISQRVYANQGQATSQQQTDEAAAEEANDVQDVDFEEVK